MILITCHIILQIDGRNYLYDAIDLHINGLNNLNKYIYLKNLSDTHPIKNFLYLELSNLIIFQSPSTS